MLLQVRVSFNATIADMRSPLLRLLWGVVCDAATVTRTCCIIIVTMALLVLVDLRIRNTPENTGTSEYKVGPQPTPRPPRKDLNTEIVPNNVSILYYNGRKSIWQPQY